jgi:hypothetical protein
MGAITPNSLSVTILFSIGCVVKSLLEHPFCGRPKVCARPHILGGQHVAYAAGIRKRVRWKPWIMPACPLDDPGLGQLNFGIL